MKALIGDIQDDQANSTPAGLPLSQARSHDAGVNDWQLNGDGETLNGFGPEEILPANPPSVTLLPVNHEGLPLMEFYYCKSVSSQPFRVNVSKSGAGWLGSCEEFRSAFDEASGTLTATTVTGKAVRKLGASDSNAKT